MLPIITAWSRHSQWMLWRTKLRDNFGKWFCSPQHDNIATSEVFTCMYHCLLVGCCPSTGFVYNRIYFRCFFFFRPQQIRWLPIMSCWPCVLGDFKVLKLVLGFWFWFFFHQFFSSKDTLWWECLDQELFRWPHHPLKGLDSNRGRCENCEAVPGYAGDVSAPKLPDDVLAVMALNAAWFHYSFWTRQFFWRDDDRVVWKTCWRFRKVSSWKYMGNKCPIEFQFFNSWNRKTSTSWMKLNEQYSSQNSPVISKSMEKSSSRWTSHLQHFSQAASRHFTSPRRTFLTDPHQWDAKHHRYSGERPCLSLLCGGFLVVHRDVRTRSQKQGGFENSSTGQMCHESSLSEETSCRWESGTSEAS